MGSVSVHVFQMDGSFNGVIFEDYLFGSLYHIKGLMLDAGQSEFHLRDFDLEKVLVFDSLFSASFLFQSHNLLKLLLKLDYGLISVWHFMMMFVSIKEKNSDVDEN
jgi:hypothetical protein